MFRFGRITMGTFVEIWFWNILIIFWTILAIATVDNLQKDIAQHSYILEK